MGHDYKLMQNGRGLVTSMGVGSPTRAATLICSQCGKAGKLNIRALMPPEQIDAKFKQAGWKLDPHICPDCQRKNNRIKEKEKHMSSQPSVAAMKAQARMFQLLSDHFDPEAGKFESGFSDDVIASTTGLKPEFVKEFRIAAFGEIKEDEAIRRLRDDIKAIEDLQREQNTAIVEAVAKLRSELAKLTKGA